MGTTWSWLKAILIVLAVLIAFVCAWFVIVFSYMFIFIGSGPKSTVSEINSVVPSPSGKAFVEKNYTFLWGGEFIKITTQIHDENGNHQLNFDKQPNAPYVGGDGIFYAWNGEKTLIVGTPSGSSVIEGPSSFGDIKIHYQTYPVSMSDILPNNVRTQNVTMDNTSFEERTWSEDSHYYGKPVQRHYRECKITVAGVSDGLFGKIKMAITSKGEEPYVGVLYGTKITYQLEPLVAEAASLTPTYVQTQYGKKLAYGEAAYLADQTPYGLVYSSRAPTEFNGLLNDAANGGLNFKVYFNFGDNVVDYRFHGKADSIQLRKFKKCDILTHKTDTLSK